jgi:hypothetical protein
MPGKPHWQPTREDGVFTAVLSRWTWFGDFLRKNTLDNTSYIYRGHANAAWKLESTLDRALRKAGKERDPEARDRHLETFMLAVRGRRGSNPPVLASENDWWALGQHHGLHTPLLDWTRSPYVAAYFAFAAAENEGARYRAVYALQANIISAYCEGAAFVKGYSSPITPPGDDLSPEDRIETFTPHSDENARLVSQSGLFTRGPEGADIESWVRKHFAGINKGILIKILIPNQDRTECMQSLNRMNINHLSLFPDLFGSSRYCNHVLTIPAY